MLNIMSNSLYSTLGVSKNANESEIKRAYRALSLKYHPDRNNTNEAESKIREINEAYDVLGDSSKRKLYDMEKQMGGNLFDFQNTGVPEKCFDHTPDTNIYTNFLTHHIYASISRFESTH